MVFDFQGSLTEEMIDHRFLRRDSWLYPAVRNLEERIDRRAATVFTSSANAERILLDQFGCDPARICPLPDCVDTDVFVPAALQDQVRLEELRRSLGLPAAKIIVYLGLLAEYQGTDLLLQAMAQVRQQDEDAYLLLMGFPGLDRIDNRHRRWASPTASSSRGECPMNWRRSILLWATWRSHPS